MRAFQRLPFPGWQRRFAIGFVVAACLGVSGLWAQPAAPQLEVQGPTLTSVEPIWVMTGAERDRWHRVKLEFLVYYYDPIWKASWGRVGSEGTYLSFSAKGMTITPGQRLLIEGLLRPAAGMSMEETRITVLGPAVPLETEPLRGRGSSVDQFERRYVELEGLVERQTMRDDHHLELAMVSEGFGYKILVLVSKDELVPQLQNLKARVRGVCSARLPDGTTKERPEIWVQTPANIEVTGSLERDELLELPAKPMSGLAEVVPGTIVRLVGAIEPSKQGQRPVLREGEVRVTLDTVQTVPGVAGDLVEAAGVLTQQDGQWILQQALMRKAPDTVTSLGQLWSLPDVEQRKWHRLKMPFTVYYYDAEWKALWGGAEERDDYLPLGDVGVPIKAGQKILVEGMITVRNGLVLEKPRVTVLAATVPLVAEDARGAIGEVDRLDKKFVMVEGYVDRQMATDKCHLELNLIVDGRMVIGRVLTDSEAKVPDWEGARLRLKGVYSATKSAGGDSVTLELWTSGLDQITLVGALEEDPRFKLEATPIEQLATLAPGTAVRILGAVRSQQPGHSLTIRDESGQTTVRTAQVRLVQHGETVQAIGRVARENGETVLHDGLFARTQAAPAVLAAGRSALRLAGQVRELRPEEAARAYPVKLSGVVTWARPEADFIFIRDGSGGVRVLLPPAASERCWIGSKVDVEGVSGPGRFAPVVLASEVTVNSTVEMPEARPVTLEQALTGIEEAQWVSMTGYVRAVEPDGPWTRLALATSAGEFHALMPPDKQWASLVDSVVRLRGVCSAVANSKRQLTDIELWVASPKYLDIEEAAPADPFAVEKRSIGSLRQFSSLEGWNRRVRVEGVVVHRTPGRLIHLQEGNEALMVLSRSTIPVKLGDRIEAVGFPGRENSRVVLREAVYRSIANALQPTPVTVEHFGVVDSELDGRLVRVEATLLDLGTQENGVRLLVQQGGQIFSALLETNQQDLRDFLQPRTRVALTGVYKLQFDEYRRPSAARVQLRSIDDVVVLKQPPWWTARRALGATALLAIVVLVGLGWVVALRRRVQQQTGMIRAQIEAEKAARLEAALARASKLESLGVFAGGIAHDFNNLLTVVIGNLSLAKLDLAGESEVLRCVNESERAAMRAKDLTQQLLTFAKGGEPMRVATELSEVVKEAAQLALHGTKVRCAFEFSAGLWPADVDRGQIGQAVNNLIINSVHAMPSGGTITIGMVNEEITEARQHLAAGRYVKTTFTDTGSGISAEHLPRIFDPYFTTKKKGQGLGLATVYSIAQKHHGHIEVASAVGLGTTFTLWLPVADRVPEAPQTVTAAAPKSKGRLLLMDDEDAIRKMATIVLRRRGHDVVAVAEGESVVREYQAARAAGQPFDLVILDLTVPGGMGGAEAMAQLRKLDPAVRAIVASGYSSDPVMAKFQEYGFRGRVPKPYEVVDLLRAVDEVMQRE